MEKLFFESTKATPLIDFDADKRSMVLTGQSYPENAFKFYDPVFSWIDNYLASNPPEIRVDIRLSYVNTSSSKCIMMLLEKLEKAFQEGVGIILNWYCDMENESEVECAEEFKEDVTFPFEIIPELMRDQ